MRLNITSSQFNMWRTLFAIAHADNILAQGEIEYMAKILEEVDFSEEQNNILKDDIDNPKDIEEMFKGVTDVKDRIEFFTIARELVYADGDYGIEEQSAMIKLARKHFQETNVDDLIGNIDLEFEDDEPYRQQRPVYANGPQHKGFAKILHSFKDRFLENLED